MKEIISSPGKHSECECYGVLQKENDNSQQTLQSWCEGDSTVGKPGGISADTEWGDDIFHCLPN